MHIASSYVSVGKLASRLLRGQPTARQWSECLRITDRPTAADNPRRRWADDEGLPTRPVPLVADGRRVASPHTVATAAAAGCAPNACAVRGRSHVPLPGHHGLDLSPTDHWAEPDDALFVDDLVVSQEGDVEVLGRLGRVRPVRTAMDLVGQFATHARLVAADGDWESDGFRGRSVLIDPSVR